MRRHALVLITTWLCALAGAWAQTPATPAPAAWFTEADAQALEQALNEVLKDSSITAAQVALVDRDGVRFVRGLGRTKRDGGQPVDTRTLMRVGSVSKSITAFALARLVEQGKLQWDAPLAQIAPEVPFDNPYKATAPLRVVHLVEHTTGWDDVPYAEYSFDQANFPVAEYARRTTPDRQSHWPPGTGFRYANGGPAVAGYLIEKLTGLPFDQAVAQLVFQPLGMTGASFAHDAARDAATTESYTHRGAPDAGHWRMGIRPSGSLSATAADMAAWTAMWARGGTASDGTPLLTPQNLQRALHAESSLAARSGVRASYAKGLFGYVAGGRLWYGHWGKTDGFRAAWGFLPASGRGFVLNVNALDGAARSKMLELLAKAATKDLPPESPLPHDAAALGALQSAEGWYVDRTPDREMAALPLAVARPLYVRVDGSGAASLVRVGSSPGDASATAYRVPAPGLLALENITEPVGALVQVDGRWQYLSGSTHHRVTAWQVWGVRALLAAAALTVLLALLTLPVWGIAALRGRLTGGVALRAWPLVAAVAAVGLIWALVPGVLLASDKDSFARAGAPTAWSWGVFAVSWLLPLAAAASVWTGWRAAPASGRWARGFALVAGVVLLGLAAYFAHHGWIGIRTWQD
jgi:CubicO group peptidase (beta-lactamase class C family)